MTTANSSAKNFVPMANKYDRIVLLVDMDCFYCQVEEKLDPSLKNLPLAVVQYNAWRGGGIIAVNYAARAKGVTRHMRGDEAKEQCPDIQLVKVPNIRQKADLTKYREAGKEVANVLQRFTPLLERASVDEAYLDITDAVNKRLNGMNDGTFILQPQELLNTYAVGFQTIGEFVTTITDSFIANPLLNNYKFDSNCIENEDLAVRQSNIRLLIGASIASEIRSAIKAETSYECSAGIAHNKILAKLACGINKPNKQTILPLSKIPGLFETLPVGKIKGLGAKFGEEVCERLNIRYLGQLLKFTEEELQRKFDEKNGTWLHNICRGIDLEAVTARFYSKSIGCCKKFPGRNNITGFKTLQHWLNELANEINERLEKDVYENNRRAKQLVFNFTQQYNGEEVSSSRSAPLPCYDTEILTKTCLEIIKANTKQFFRSGSESILNNPITFLGLSVGKFETISNSQNNIQEMFAQQAAKKQKFINVPNEEIKTSNLNTSLVNSETSSDPKTTNDYEDNSIKQMPKEIKSQNVKSIFLNTSKSVNIETDSATKTDIEQNSNTLKTMPKDKKTENIKSFFINALKKEEHAEKKNPSNDKCKSNSSNQINIKMFPVLLVTSSDGKEDSIRKETDSELLGWHNLNENQNPERYDTNFNEQNDLISEVYTIQKEENKTTTIENEELKNEIKNNFLGNIIIDGEHKTILKSTVQISNNVPVLNTSINMKRKYDEISDTEFNQTNYLSRYAEFALPELTTTLLQFTTCSKCGGKIFNDPISIQSHDDYHFAHELSNQQRHEFRNEIRAKINTSKSPPCNVSNKKSKKVHHHISVKKTSADITKFLKPSSPSTLLSTFKCDKNQATESSTSNIKICDICKLPIKIENILEHKDFHMAKDLQRKLNQLEVHTVEVVKKPASGSRHSKVTPTPIKQFFTQSNI